MMNRTLLLPEIKNNISSMTHNITIVTMPSHIAKTHIIPQIHLILHSQDKASNKETPILTIMILQAISNHQQQILMKLGMNLLKINIEKMWLKTEKQHKID